jgi:hypothetical protein
VLKYGGRRGDGDEDGEFLGLDNERELDFTLDAWQSL